MAKYLGLLTTDIRGKVGGVVFSRNRSGTIMRARAYPTNANANNYPQQANPVIDAGSQWLNFSATENLEWSIWSAGFAFYMGVNPYTELVATLTYFTDSVNNGAAIGIAPSPNGGVPLPIPPAAVAFGMSVGGGIVTCSAVNATEWADHYWIVYLDIAASSTSDIPPTTGGSVMGGGKFTDTVDITAAYLAAFGQLPAVDQVLFAHIWSCCRYGLNRTYALHVTTQVGILS